MAVKPGYKQTEVGDIPEDWGVRSIGQMFGLVNGCAFKPEDWKQSGTPIIRIQNLNDPSASFNYSHAPVAERNRVEAGDLLFAWSGTIGTSFGARVWSGPSGVLNQHIFKVHMDQQKITLPFALLVFARVEDDIAKQAHGFKASFVHVKKSDLVKVSIPLPPLHEQHAIATALSDVDALLGALERLIAKKRDLKKAAMQQLLTGKTRLPGFQGEWEEKTLGSVLKTGRLGGNYANQDAETETPLMKMGNLARGYFDLSKVQFTTPGVTPEVNHRLCFGDVLLNTRNTLDLVGKVAIWRDELPVAYYNSNLMRLEFDPEQLCSNQFANYALNTDSVISSLRGLATGTTSVAAIYTRDLMKLKVIVPPLPEQAAIATVLTDMDAELVALEQRLAKTRALKQGMMQELLTGRTRLV